MKTMNQTERFLIQQQAQQDLIWAHTVDFVQSDYVDEVVDLLADLSTVEPKHWPAVLGRQHRNTLRSVMSLATTALGEAQLRVCQRKYNERTEEEKDEGGRMKDELTTDN